MELPLNSQDLPPFFRFIVRPVADGKRWRVGSRPAGEGNLMGLWPQSVFCRLSLSPSPCLSHGWLIHTAAELGDPEVSSCGSQLWSDLDGA